MMTNVPFKQWLKDMSKFVWRGKKLRIKCKLLQGGKGRKGLGLPDLKLYFAVYCLV